MSGDSAGARRSAWQAFAQPAAWTLFLFGFSSGLPFLLVSGTLAYWLKDGGVDLKEITVIASAGLTYAFKFLWAPALDHARPPLFAALGRRRGWLLCAQFAVLLGLLAMAWVTPARLSVFIAATLLVAFAGATQDIAVDAYRIEIAPAADQGALTATYSLGYRVALIVTGALALIAADHLAWPAIYALLAALMLVPIVAAWRAREPATRASTREHWAEAMHTAIVAPFTDFFRRYGLLTALLTLGFILTLKIPEQALVGGIMGPFYLDMGFSKTEVGSITKIYGVWIGIVGVFLGGLAVARWGVRGPLLVSVVGCALCNLLYVWLTRHPGSLAALTLVISFENLSLGFLGTATVAFLSSLVNREHTATQYALLSSLVNLPGKLLGIFAGAIVEATSYSEYFVIATVAVGPGSLVFLVLWGRLPPDETRAS